MRVWAKFGYFCFKTFVSYGPKRPRSPYDRKSAKFGFSGPQWAVPYADGGDPVSAGPRHPHPGFPRPRVPLPAGHRATSVSIGGGTAPGLRRCRHYVDGHRRMSGDGERSRLRPRVPFPGATAEGAQGGRADFSWRDQAPRSRRMACRVATRRRRRRRSRAQPDQ